MGIGGVVGSAVVGVLGVDSSQLQEFEACTLLIAYPEPGARYEIPSTWYDFVMANCSCLYTRTYVYTMSCPSKVKTN